jgi:hypothetical protein
MNILTAREAAQKSKTSVRFINWAMRQGLLKSFRVNSRQSNTTEEWLSHFILNYSSEKGNKTKNRSKGHAQKTDKKAGWEQYKNSMKKN